jgi:Asp-tRNA(Asn)/Glu-tRNA(Gln) amidotransferase A subunit family amidase
MPIGSPSTVPAGTLTTGWPVMLNGHAVVNVPAGTVDGLPVGMQVVGPAYGEPQLLEVAAAVEAVAGWEYPEP